MSLKLVNNNSTCDKACPPEKPGFSDTFASLCARISNVFSCFVSCFSYLWNRNSQKTSEPPVGKETDVISSNSFSLMNVGNNQKQHNFNERMEENLAYLSGEYNSNEENLGINPITYAPKTIADKAFDIVIEMQNADDAQVLARATTTVKEIAEKSESVNNETDAQALSKAIEILEKFGNTPQEQYISLV